MRLALIGMAFLSVVSGCSAATPLEIYSSLKAAHLTLAADVKDFQFKKDRFEVVLNGRLYLQAPIQGHVRSAVFVGNGSLKIEAPPVDFEKSSLKRIWGLDSVDTTFKTLVLRVSDGLLDTVAAQAEPQQPSAEAKELSEKFESHLLRKTGINASSRITRSIVNDERAPFFLAEFDKGPLGRFGALLDEEGEIPSLMFDLNAGERGLLFRYLEPSFGSELILSFLSRQDYSSGSFQYSEVYEAANLDRIRMQLDATDIARRSLRNELEMKGKFLRDTSALLVRINDGLNEYDDERRKRFTELTSALDGAGNTLTIVQEPWEIGATIFLTSKALKGQELTLTLKTAGKPVFTAADGEYMTRYYSQFGGIEPQGELVENLFFPASTTSWYPHLGYLDRAHYEMTFLHSKKVSAVGMGRQTGPVEDLSGGIQKTTWQTEQATPFAGFAIGDYVRNSSKTPKTGIELEYYSPRLSLADDKQTFMLTEIGNGIDLFSELFGKYPSGVLKGVYHPRPFGQGMSTLVFLPPIGRAENRFTLGLISHEISHQWWGNTVAWRSYRDQWLSEGFATYSAVLYTKARLNREAMLDEVKLMRKRLLIPPFGETRVGKGRVNDIGPLILGRRLGNPSTANAYTALVYEKGGLVLRMLHFLLTDPSTGNDQAFFDMLRDFVTRFQDRAASTEGFANLASQHFARSPIGRKYGYQHLGWFFRQWVYQSDLPSYRFEYSIEKLEDGKVVLNGKLFQEDAPANWEMPLPLVLTFGKDQLARGSVLAKGPVTDVRIPLPSVPKDVQLDPDSWVLSARTLTVAAKK